MRNKVLKLLAIASLLSIVPLSISNAYADKSQVKGVAGPVGPAGATGLTGPAGPAGATGLTGPAGPAGATGLTGPAGPASPTGAAGPVHFIGDKYQGGIIFYVSPDGQHGLIAALADQSFGVQWNNGIYGHVGATGDGLFAGAMNTTIEVSTQIRDTPGGNFAALVAANYSIQDDGLTPCTASTTESCYGDWYLPSKEEFSLLYHSGVAGFGNGVYWTSTEGDASNAWLMDVYYGTQYTTVKGTTLRVRAVRAF
jgi:hypothetical protein